MIAYGETKVPARRGNAGQVFNLYFERISAPIIRRTIPIRCSPPSLVEAKKCEIHEAAVNASPKIINQVPKRDRRLGG